MFLTNPISLNADENKSLQSVSAIRMELVASKDGGRKRPVPIEGSEFDVKIDWLISAIGQEVDIDILKKTDLVMDKKTWAVQVNEPNHMTSIEGVFAAGDGVTGPSTVIAAIGHARKAADEIDCYLMKKTDESKNEYVRFMTDLGKVDKSTYNHCETSKRCEMPELDAKERIKTFEEVETGFSTEQTLLETSRCLECGCSEYIGCELRNYATDYQADPAKFLGDYREFKVDDTLEYIIFDPNKCINCGRCVRTCKDIMGVSAISFIHRGFNAIVRPAMEKTLSETNCIGCGNCADACPTGAISIRRPAQASGTLSRYNVKTVCGVCSVGCSINYKIVHDKLIYPSNTTDDVISEHNDGYLCSGGRFAYEHLISEDRLTVPFEKNTAENREFTWTEAIEKTAVSLKDIISKNGADSVAVFASPLLSNEELHLTQKLARTAIGTNNVASFTELLHKNDLNCLDNILGKTTSTCTSKDLEAADVIIFINMKFPEDNLIVQLKAIKAQKAGTKIIVIDPDKTEFSRNANLWLDTKNVLNKKLLNELCPSPDTNIVFVANLDRESINSAADLNEISRFLKESNRIEKPGNGLLLMRDHANANGLRKILKPETQDLLQKMENGTIKAAVVIGENPLAEENNLKYFKNLEFLTVSDIFHTPTVDAADIVLPASSYLEDDGSFTSFEDKIQRCNMVVSPKGLRNREWLVMLAEKLGHKWNYASNKEIFEEIKV
ncbi:molybdopterin-dependent oxidoreductase [bacterium]|nr:molybdopterin-dependent oxidoreductase [bacterium]